MAKQIVRSNNIVSFQSSTKKPFTHTWVFAAICWIVGFLLPFALIYSSYLMFKR